MLKIVLPFIFSLIITSISIAKDIDLFILAGQSNAQGWQGNAKFYPSDPEKLDLTIPFYWTTPHFSNSKGQWTTLKAQGGRFKQGHFGLEVTFARALKKAGYSPALFKYTLGGTSIAKDWKGPGEGGMYDDMVKDLRNAIGLLQKNGDKVNIRAFIWIQGESDGETLSMANAYQKRLQTLINDLRNNVIHNPKLPIILGVDEQHGWMVKNPQVIKAQQSIAQADPHIIFTSMLGLEKADSTHLKPKALEQHGLRIFKAFQKLNK